MAVQAAGMHDTPSNWLVSRSGGLGVVWILQWALFHTSAKVVSTNALLRKDPTAVQEVGDTHDTLDKPPKTRRRPLVSVFSRSSRWPSLQARLVAVSLADLVARAFGAGEAARSAV